MASESESGCKQFEDPPCQKDTINQWIKDGVDLVSLIDQGEIRNVSDVKQYLACSVDSGGLDRANIFGQTTLMIACRNGQKGIVKFLLEAGADPNLTCSIGNSALHFACQGDKDEVIKLREKPNYPQEKLLEIIKIVELLANHGAMLQMNEDGLSPVCVAALNSFKDVVAFFASSNVISVPLDEKVKAYELLGVSQAIFDQHHAIDACESFHIAVSLQSEDLSDVASRRIISDIMSKKNARRSEEFEVKVKAYLMGLQCLPAKIKVEYDFWKALAECAEDALFNGKAVEEGYKMLVALIKEEMLEENLLGTVMEMIEDASEPSIHVSSERLRFIPELLGVYAEAFRVNKSQSRGKTCKILENMGQVLFKLAYYPSESKYLLLSLPFVGCILNCIRKMSAEETSGDTDEGKSITAIFFDHMADAMWEDVYSWQSKKARNRLKFTICRLLYYNGFDQDSDKSLLQTLLEVVPVARDMEFIISVSRVLIRYGCPTDDACLEDADEDDPEGAELLELIGPSTTTVPLEELAARAVLRHRIPYRERLPVMLCEKIEGEKLSPDPSELDSSAESDSD